MLPLRRCLCIQPLSSQSLPFAFSLPALASLTPVLAELDNLVAMKEKELAALEATNLDSLCDNLKRIQAEVRPDVEFVLEEMEIYEPACCRMLGVCNGRTDFDTGNSLSWAADGSLCSNTASN